MFQVVKWLTRPMKTVSHPRRPASDSWRGPTTFALVAWLLAIAPDSAADALGDARANESIEVRPQVSELLT